MANISTHFNYEPYKQSTYYVHMDKNVAIDRCAAEVAALYSAMFRPKGHDLDAKDCPLAFPEQSLVDVFERNLKHKIISELNNNKTICLESDNQVEQQLHWEIAEKIFEKDYIFWKNRAQFFPPKRATIIRHLHEEKKIEIEAWKNSRIVQGRRPPYTTPDRVAYTGEWELIFYTYAGESTGYSPGDEDCEHICIGPYFGCINHNELMLFDLREKNPIPKTIVLEHIHSISRIHKIAENQLITFAWNPEKLLRPDQATEIVIWEFTDDGRITIKQRLKLHHIDHVFGPFQNHFYLLRHVDGQFSLFNRESFEVVKKFEVSYLGINYWLPRSFNGEIIRFCHLEPDIALLYNVKDFQMRMDEFTHGGRYPDEIILFENETYMVTEKIEEDVYLRIRDLNSNEILYEGEKVRQLTMEGHKVIERTTIETKGIKTMRLKIYDWRSCLSTMIF